MIEVIELILQKGEAEVERDWAWAYTTQSLIIGEEKENLEVPPAQGTWPMPHEPALDAWQMELVPTMGQAPHSFPYLKVLNMKNITNKQKKKKKATLDLINQNAK